MSRLLSPGLVAVRVAVAVAGGLILAGRARGQEPDCCAAPVAAGFSALRVSSPDPHTEWIDSSDACLGAGGTLVFGGFPGTRPLASLWVTISSNGAGSGVRGWSLSILVDGEIEIAGVRSSLAPSSDRCTLCVGCCQSSAEIVDPAQNDGQRGIVATGYLLEGALPATGTEWVLEILLLPPNDLEEQPQAGTVRLSSGLRNAAGQAVHNVAVLGGETAAICNDGAAVVNVEFDQHPIVRQAYVRGDANDDARVDIADPIWILAFLFTGGPRACDAAADANGDLAVDLSDAIYILGYAFLGTPAPPAPFPGCGLTSRVYCVGQVSCI